MTTSAHGDAGSGRARLVLARAALLVTACIVALLLAELLLKLVVPHAGMEMARELDWFRRADSLGELFVVDPELGFRPKLGTAYANEWGTRPNDYRIDKPSGVTRVLFVGDSVTRRGHMIEGLRELYGDESFEYWNAGVESFNVMQEISFFERFNAATDPDHVVLSLHNNDFETTPVAFREKGRLVVYAPEHPRAEVNEWLFRNSHVYRIAWGLVLRARDRWEKPSPSIVRESEERLVRFRDLLEERGVRLSIVVLPLFGPPESWSDEENRSREHALRIVEIHGFRYFDPLPALRSALEEGVEVQEPAGDRWHPSPEMGRRLARHLFDQGIFED
jgi:hypothetical protein